VPPLFRAIQGIIFDLDDTLAPEADFALSGFRVVASYLADLTGLEEAAIFLRMKFHFEGGRKKEIFNAVMEEFTISLEKVPVKKLVELYRHHYPDSSYRLFPDALSCLPYFASHYRCALITDGSPPQQEQKISSLGIQHYFSSIQVNHEPEFFKPHPLSYQNTIRALALEPSMIMVVADNPAKDFITPNMMDMVTVRVRRKGIYSRKTGNKEARAAFSIKNLEELKELMRGGQR
jgi:putative hydrolase of the HAD superfamily